MPSPIPTPLKVQPVDELPDDDYESPKAEWEKVTEFRGTVAGASVNNAGELTLSIRVPFEDKYLAMPVTDTRSVLMVFAVFKPIVVQHPEKKDLDTIWEGDNGGS